MRWRSVLERAFLEARFSNRAASILALHTDIRDLEDLRTRPWHVERGRGLGDTLVNIPHCGSKVMGEIRAFRQFGDPRRCLEMVSIPVTVWLEPLQLSVLDDWISTQSKRLSRRAALRVLMADALEHDCASASWTSPDHGCEQR